MKVKTDDLKNDWLPVWIPVIRNPWRLRNIGTGNWLRKLGQETGFNPVYTFSSAEKALVFLNSSEGKKAIKLQSGS